MQSNFDHPENNFKCSLKSNPDLGVWIPVIEIRCGANFSVERSLWWRLEDGSLHRQQWNTQIGSMINISRTFQSLETRCAAQKMLDDLRPFYTRSSGIVVSFVYDEMLWRDLIVQSINLQSKDASKIYIFNADNYSNIFESDQSVIEAAMPV